MDHPVRCLHLRKDQGSTVDQKRTVSRRAHFAVSL